ncbi:MAG TPA: MFS transporter [Gaiellaceae bacterium]|nr:MFS transporter [Gaiellaceae bacterium]
MTTAEPELEAPIAQERGGAFRSLRIPSFRWWFVAQIFSGSGGMAQLVGQAWLVLHVLHKGGLALGVISAVQFAPVLLGGAWAGAMLTHLDVRRTLITTQIAAGSIATVLGVLVVTGTVRLWMVVLCAVANGGVFAIDQPARQLYVVNLVGRDRVASAVGLFEVIINASRVLGPSSGGIVLALFGTAACFFVNAGSFVAPLVVLLAYRPRETAAPAQRRRTHEALHAGLSYARHTPAIAACLLMAAAGGMIFNTGIALPVLATHTFGLGKAGLGVFTACFGIGAIPGALAAAYTRGLALGQRVRLLCLLTGFAVLAVASAPDRLFAFPLMLLVGFFSIWMIALANTLVQLRPDPSLRGPVMGLWTMVLPGLSPVTGLVTGAVTQYAGPRFGYGIAGVALAGAALAGWRALSD